MQELNIDNGDLAFSCGTCSSLKGGRKLTQLVNEIDAVPQHYFFQVAVLQWMALSRKLGCKGCSKKYTRTHILVGELAFYE